jgi:hypothetical protein
MSNSLNKANKDGILFYLSILTGFFILFEISFFIQCNQQYLFDVGVVTRQISVPAAILPEIFLFLTIQLCLHIIYCLLIWFSAVYCSYLFSVPARLRMPFAVLLWFAGIVSILAYNQILFPNSRYADLASMLIPESAARAAAITLALTCFAAFCCALFGFLLYSVEKSINYLLFFMLILAGATWIWQQNHVKPATMPANYSRMPNVVMIGIDSLRPDIMGYFGGGANTPFLDNILGQSTVFANAVTPLARTFPSWVSILTGKYPKDSGVRSNLTAISDKQLSQTLPSIFKKNGYQTVFATDETRFSNIDKRFGFNHIISPPIGLNDFLLGTFNDFPLSNLLINTSLGKQLFPYSYANRPAVVTYQPDTFLHELRSYLLQPRSQPIFMAVHFCLPHFPYVWADLLAENLSIRERYLASVHRTDQQVAGLFQILDQSGLLKNTIIVLLSDHGEALELPGDRITARDTFVGKLNSQGKIPKFYPRSLDDEGVNQSAGHGTDVLGLPQYHSLLAFKFFGIPRKHLDISSVVSLIDIKPTLLDLVGIKSTGGQSLAAAISGRKLSSRHILMESDYSPESIRTIHPDVSKAMLQGAHLFQIDPVTTRLHLKPVMLRKIMESKQYADIFGSWMLAIYPQPDRTYQPILINLETGRWTNDLASEFANKSPAKLMYRQVKMYAAQH